MLGAFHRLGKEPSAAIQQTLDEVYELFPVIARLRKRFAGFTSGGEQQILAIGRALMAKPRLLLLDEPSMGLSPKLTTFVAESLMTLRRTGLAMVLVEQNVSLALQLADRAIVMETGHPALQGTTDELRANERSGRSTWGSRRPPRLTDDAPTDAPAGSGRDLTAGAGDGDDQGGPELTRTQDFPWVEPLDSNARWTSASGYSSVMTRPGDTCPSWTRSMTRRKSVGWS